MIRRWIPPDRVSEVSTGSMVVKSRETAATASYSCAVTLAAVAAALPEELPELAGALLPELAGALLPEEPPHALRTSIMSASRIARIFLAFMRDFLLFFSPEFSF